MPPYSPKLNPVENVWQCRRQNHLGNRVYDTYDAIVDACCDAWNALFADPARITTIASRDRAPVNAWGRWYRTKQPSANPARFKARPRTGLVRISHSVAAVIATSSATTIMSSAKPAAGQSRNRFSKRMMNRSSARRGPAP